MSLTKGNEQWSCLNAVIAKLWTWIRAKYLRAVFLLGFTGNLRGRNLPGNWKREGGWKRKKGVELEFLFLFCTRSKSSSAQDRHRINTQKGCVSEILCLCIDTEYLCSGHVTRCVEALFINLKGFRACAPELIHSQLRSQSVKYPKYVLKTDANRADGDSHKERVWIRLMAPNFVPLY